MISVIVPVFNTYRYLKKCISSVLSQTYTDFENALKNIYSTKFLSAKVVSYTVVDKTNYKLFYIIDGDNNTFIFKEKSIMNYTVYLDSYTIEK